MIKRIDIEKFGQFEKSNWPKDKDLKQLNIFFGRNYTGKTTLSRIFDVINGHQDLNFDDAFKLKYFNHVINKEEEYSSGDLSKLRKKLQIYVYNEAYIKRNLNFFYEDKGDLEPFTVLGNVNNDLYEEEKNIISQLYGGDDLQNNPTEGSVLGRINKIEGEVKELTAEHTKKKNELETYLTTTANQVKLNRDIFIDNHKDYNKTNLKADLNDNNFPRERLTEQEIEQKKSTIRESNIEPKNQTTIVIRLQVSQLQDEIITLLNIKISPSSTLERLENNQIKHEHKVWVQAGASYHQELQLNNCLFCGNNLKMNLWDELDKYFNEELKNFQLEAKIVSSKLQIEDQKLSDFIDTLKLDLYNDFKVKSQKVVVEIKEAINQLRALIKSYSQLVTYKTENPQEVNQDITPSNTLLTFLETKISELNKIINESNQYGTTIIEHSNKCKRELRLNYLIDAYEECVNVNKELKKHDELLKTLEETKNELQKTKIELDDRLRSIKSKYQNESVAAKKINELLRNHFEDVVFELRTVEGSDVKFKVYRNNSIASNLSLGERNIISLCYFITKTSAEIKDEANAGKQSIVFIDDPVNSVDKENIFYIYGMISELIGQLSGSTQFFITTHNLEFLKFTHRLGPCEPNIVSLKPMKGVMRYLILKRLLSNDSKIPSSYVEEMDYKFIEYGTEFLFLKDKLVEIESRTDLINNYELYPYGNYLRKFLESFLFFKFPIEASQHKNGPLGLMKKYFGDYGSTIERAVNEKSHLASPVYSSSTFESTEILKVCKNVIQEIRKKDPDYLQQS